MSFLNFSIFGNMMEYCVSHLYRAYVDVYQLVHTIDGSKGLGIMSRLRLKKHHITNKKKLDILDL